MQNRDHENKLLQDNVYALGCTRILSVRFTNLDALYDTNLGQGPVLDITSFSLTLCCLAMSFC